MEPEVEYKTKNRPFHGDYTSPGQGKRRKQYSDSGKLFLIAVAGLVVLLIVMKFFF
jgi:hypothetical protein